MGGERKSHPLFVTSILFNSHTLLFPSTLIPLIPFLSPLPPRFFVYSPHTVYFYFVLTLFLLVSIHRVCTALLLLGYYVIFFSLAVNVGGENFSSLLKLFLLSILILFYLHQSAAIFFMDYQRIELEM